SEWNPHKSRIKVFLHLNRLTCNNAAMSASTEPIPAPNRKLTAVLVAALIAIYLFQMLSSVHEQSQTWDEQDHIFAGYMTWKTSDFGLNPEHPPLVKYVATIPILNMQLSV